MLDMFVRSARAKPNDWRKYRDKLAEYTRSWCIEMRYTGRWGVICDGKQSETFTADRTSRLCLLSVESTMSLPYQTVMR